MLARNYHLDGVVQIDGEWASLGGRHFKIEDIQGVAVQKIGTNWLLVAPLIFFIVAAVILQIQLSYALFYSSGLACVSALLLGFSFVLFLTMTIRALIGPPAYLIRLKGTFGTMNAFICADPDYANDIVKAIRAAMQRPKPRRVAGV